MVQPYTANKSTNVHLNSRKAKNQKPSEFLNVGRYVQMRGDLCCSTLKMKNKKKWRRQSRIFCKTNLDYSSKSHTFAFTTGHSFAPKHKSRHESKIISASDSKWFSEVCYSLFDNDILILLCRFFSCYKSCWKKKSNSKVCFYCFLNNTAYQFYNLIKELKWKVC